MKLGDVFEKWAPAHNLTVEEAIKKFPEEAGICRFGKPEEIADLLSYLVSPAAKWMHRRVCAYGLRRDQGHLGQTLLGRRVGMILDGACRLTNGGFNFMSLER